MTEKKCSKCSEIKPLEEFCIQTRSKDGRASYCKVCKAKADREYRDRKGEELLEKKRAYYVENKEVILAREKERKKDPEVKKKVLLQKKAYHAKNKEVLSKKKKAYYQKNKEAIKKRVMDNYYKDPKKTIDRNVKYERERRRKDPTFRLMLNTKNAIYKAIVRENGGKNGSKTLDSLPYTIEQLKEHLEKQFDENMTWDNYGSYWHVDHIYPQSKLPFKSLSDKNFELCWSLNNLRPLEASENLQKSNKIITDIKCP
jgi:hypothetical protein